MSREWQRHKFRWYVKRASNADKDPETGQFREPVLRKSLCPRRCYYTSKVIARIADFGPRQCYQWIMSAPESSRIHYSPYYVSLCRLAKEYVDWPVPVHLRSGLIRDKYDQWAAGEPLRKVIARLPEQPNPIRYDALMRVGDLVWVGDKPLAYEDAIYELSEVLNRRWRVGVRRKEGHEDLFSATIQDEFGNVVCGSVPSAVVARHIVFLHNTWLRLNATGWLQHGQKAKVPKDA